MWLFACAPATPDVSELDPCEAEAVGQVQFPEDERPHGAPVEWWYWTGHLYDGRWYGFEQVFFLFDYEGAIWQMAHFALTDVDGDAFAYDVRYEVWDGATPDTGYAFALGDWTARGLAGEDTLHGAAGAYTLDLVLHPEDGPVLHHGDGYTDYSFGGNTFYYSRMRMDAQGTLDVAGEDRVVTGTGWFDHQWGELGTAVDAGWDWFAVQLDDGRELMLHYVRAGVTPQLVGGTLSEGCAAREVTATVTPTGSWGNADGCYYPSGWTIEVEGMHLTVDPIRDDQELSLAYDSYWEGAAVVSGDATGRAYVELTGYCP